MLTKSFTLLMLAAILGFGCSRGAEAPPTVAPSNASSPVAKVTPEQKGFRDSRIQSEADKIVQLFGSMPKVAVFVVDEPIDPKTAGIERGVAYTLCSADKIPVVYLKKAFSARAPRPQIVNILKHELTHAWFCTQGISTGHDARFQSKFREIGGFGN